MCLILFSYQQSSTQRLTLIANRDELHARPACPARLWTNASGVYAGQDLEAGGTWLGVNNRGRVAAITNHRNPNLSLGSVSRGELCTKFLTTSISAKQYLEDVQCNKTNYSGFNLLLDDGESLYYYSNVQNEIHCLEPGFYGLSNELLNSPWPKSETGVSSLKKTLKTAYNDEQLFSILRDESQPADEELPSTGVGIGTERLLGSKFICSPDYGTRASTLLSINDKIRLRERGFDSTGKIAHDVNFSLNKQKS